MKFFFKRFLFEFLIRNRSKYPKEEERLFDSFVDSNQNVKKIKSKKSQFIIFQNQRHPSTAACRSYQSWWSCSVNCTSDP